MTTTVLEGKYQEACLGNIGEQNKEANRPDKIIDTAKGVTE